MTSAFKANKPVVFLSYSKEDTDIFEALRKVHSGSIFEKLSIIIGSYDKLDPIFGVNSQVASQTDILPSVDHESEIKTLRQKVNELEDELGELERYRPLREIADRELERQRQRCAAKENKNVEYEMYG